MIRLADTYLMDLGGSGVRAQALLDAVRIGWTSSVPVSLDAIYHGRMELAVGADGMIL